MVKPYISSRTVDRRNSYNKKIERQAHILLIEYRPAVNLINFNETYCFYVISIIYPKFLFKI